MSSEVKSNCCVGLGNLWNVFAVQLQKKKGEKKDE